MEEMKKILFALILGVLLIGMIHAELSFWQVKEDLGNSTTRNHMVFCYNKIQVSGINSIGDFITGDNPFESYIKYNVYVKKFNADNPAYRVDWCSFIIQQSTPLTNFSTVFNQTYTSSDYDTLNANYFLRMGDGDCVIADEICQYNSSVTLDSPNLILPAEMQLVAPTWECKACQYYEWSVTEKDTIKAKSVGDNVVTVSGYIQKLFSINYEIVLILFWIFLILMIFISVGLIFIGIYWVFIYLRSLAK